MFDNIIRGPRPIDFQIVAWNTAVKYLRRKGIQDGKWSPGEVPEIYIAPSHVRRDPILKHIFKTEDALRRVMEAVEKFGAWETITNGAIKRYWVKGTVERRK